MIARLLIPSLLLLASPFGAFAIVAPQERVVKELVYPVTKPATPAVTESVSPMAISKKAAVAAGMMLAFNSGFTNGACLGGGLLAGTDKFAVAAVTGAWTTSALGAASGNMAAFATNAKAILSYVTGSCIAGLMIPRPKTFVLDNGTGPTFLIGSALLYAASRFAQSSPGTKTCFFLALMANGLQNSVTSVHTANLCRSAHFSGITSDIGTFLGQCLRGNFDNAFKLKVFALLGLSFWVGGFTAFFAANNYTTSTLYFSAALHAFVGLSLLMNNK
ncbi:membrAne [Seminavis robusta]|uniref:MembrAne n=1 Tax=Seminavis robusta TaxID=568900 RepID=A0A9N8ELT1_9STRA|nr:membrAne [Seminavis robusta]|eukprot:Sro1329_g263300.1 membrAne (275) ;mRNA; r:7564-8388